MPIGLGDHRRRRRRQFRWAAFKWLIGLALIAGAGAYAYQSGARLANARIDPLEHQVSTLEASVADLTREKEFAGQRADRRAGERRDVAEAL